MTITLSEQTQIIAFKDYDEFEERLRAAVERELHGRKEDLMHTQSVVKNMKRLVILEGGRRDILVTLAYLHEISRAGDSAVIDPARSAVMQRCSLCAGHAKSMLAELGFPEAKANQVVALLESNACMELKRAHHQII